MKKQTTIALFAASLIATTSAFAWFGESDGYKEKSGHHKRSGFKQGEMMKKVSAHMDREFSADQIRTLSQARLIMKDNPNLRIDEVTSTDSGYNVTIVTQDNSLVEELKLAKNGMPLERYETVKQRLEERSSREQKEDGRKQRKERKKDRKAQASRSGHRGKQYGKQWMSREFTADQIETPDQCQTDYAGQREP